MLQQVPSTQKPLWQALGWPDWQASPLGSFGVQLPLNVSQYLSLVQSPSTWHCPRHTGPEQLP